MAITDSDIFQITETVWSSVLGLHLEPSDHAISEKDQKGFLGAYVRITGTWTGVVTLRCSSGLAQQAARAMFASDNPSLEDIRDMLGELVNMIGGNIKSLLPNPCHLSLPAVTVGLDSRFNSPGECLVTQVVCSCEGQPLLISILQPVSSLQTTAEN